MKEHSMNSAIEQIVVTTPDMSCEHCVNAIQGDLGAVEGVEQVKADLPTKQVTISFDPGKVSVPQIEAALDAAGYPVAK
jgi:copper ion binding protein